MLYPDLISVNRLLIMIMPCEKILYVFCLSCFDMFTFSINLLEQIRFIFQGRYTQLQHVLYIYLYFRANE
jgi:hypothetical protein